MANAVQVLFYTQNTEVNNNAEKTEETMPLSRLPEADRRSVLRGTPAY